MPAAPAGADQRPRARQTILGRQRPHGCLALGAVDIQDVEPVPGGQADVGLGVAGPPGQDPGPICRGVLDPMGDQAAQGVLGGLAAARIPTRAAGRRPGGHNWPAVGEGLEVAVVGEGIDLWVADFGPDGRLGPASHVAGGPHESVVQPEWNAEGILHFVSDRTGWWNLYREHHGQVESLLAMAAEFADAPWELDYSSYAFVGDGRLACRYRQHGRDRLGLLDPQSGRLTDLPIPYTSLKPYLRAVGDRLAFIGASPTASSALATLYVPTGRLDVLAGAEVSLDPAWVSVPKPIQFPARDGQAAYALYYPPTLRSPGRRMPGRRCWCRPILVRRPTPRPAWTSGSSSSPVGGSRWWT
jgi:hypothetical protein